MILPYLYGRSQARLPMSPNRRLAQLDRLRLEYERLRGELSRLGYVLQGSVTERRLPCGKAACACTTDIQARHGPYFQWSLKREGRTVSAYLIPQQARLCRQWIENNRQLERIVRNMRDLSLRVAHLHEIPEL